MDDTVKNAENLLKRSNFILSNIDSWKNLPLENNSEIVVPIDGSTPALTNITVQKTNDKSLFSTKNRKHGKDSEAIETERNNVIHSIRSSKKHRSGSWKHEILSKIESLENELDEMKSSYERQDKLENRRNDQEVPPLLLDIVSSQSSSPVKMRPYNSAKIAEGNVNRDRTARLKGNEIVEAKQIMDRGLKTARELNEKWELWKRKERTRKDVSVQVSLPDVQPTQIDNEMNICYLAEKLTNLLLEQPTKVKKRKTLRKNFGNSVLVSSHNVNNSIEPHCRLVIQRLPDNCIKDSLSTQALPSIVIPPTTLQSPSVDNTKLFCLNHSSKEKNGYVESNTPPTPHKKTIIMKKTKIDQTDIGLQVDLSDSNSSSSEFTIESKLEALKIRNKSFIDDFNETQKIRDFLKKVEESSEACKKYRSSKSSLVSNRSGNKKSACSESYSSHSLSSKTSLSDKLKSLENQNNLIVDDFNETQKLKKLLKKLKESSKVSKDYRTKSHAVVENKISVESSASNSNKKISSINQIDNYKSDFEVESLEEDNKSLTSSLSKISSIDNVESHFKPNKTPSIGSKRSKTSSLTAIESKVYPSNTVSTDESLLEAQMKRLGISPERVTISRKPLEGKVKSIKSSHKDNKIKRVSSTKPENSGRRKTLYVKSDGSFIPLESLDTPNVQIIVPEIVVKLPDTLKASMTAVKSPTSSRSSHSARQLKQDQVIQTNEEFGTMTFGDTSLVVNKLNQHFERTQLLLDRIGSVAVKDMGQPCSNDVLSFLHRSRNHGTDKNGFEISPGEIKKAEFKVPSRPTFLFKDELNSIGYNSESIGEVFNHYK